MGSLTVNGVCRITRDPDTRPGPSGTWYSFGIAAYRKNALDGKQSVDFFEADLYIKTANADQAKSIVKGKLMYIETAYLRNDEFTGNDGNKKNRVKLQIVTYELLNDKVDSRPAETSEGPKTFVNLKSCHPSDLPPPMNMPTKKERFVQAPLEEIREECVVSDKTNEDEPPF